MSWHGRYIGHDPRPGGQQRLQASQPDMGPESGVDEQHTTRGRSIKAYTSEPPGRDGGSLIQEKTGTSLRDDRRGVANHAGHEADIRTK